MLIPQDLFDFLSIPENREMMFAGGEVSRVTFFAPEELKREKFVVDGFELFLNGPLKADPKEKREYEGVSLIRDCNDYRPKGVLTWFPVFNAYGAADTGHERIIIYTGVTWKKIEKDPGPYINGQWYPEEVKHVEINPWLKKSRWKFW